MASAALKSRGAGSTLQTDRERVIVSEGEYRVSDRSETVLTAVLGSCISACLHDPMAGVGGMNHFLLASPKQLNLADRDAIKRYGVHAMEVLVNELISRGSTRQTLRAHLYGGANMHAGMRAIGDENAAFARQFLANEGIVLVHADMGGHSARRVEFRPVAGLARSKFVVSPATEPARATGTRIVGGEAGEVTLF